MTVKSGNLIADAMDKVGKDGVITVEESKESKPLLKLLKECNLIRILST